MEITERAKNGNIMNIKEEFQIYYYNKHNKLIDNQQNMFDLIIQHMNTPSVTS
jgi:hypothetical protein